MNSPSPPVQYPSNVQMPSMSTPSVQMPSMPIPSRNIPQSSKQVPSYVDMNMMNSPSKPVKKIPQPVGVDELLKELRQNEIESKSEMVSRSEKSRSIQLGRPMMKKPEKTIQLEL